MTREEAAERIETIKMILEECIEDEDDVSYITSDDANALDMAIKVLEQEPVLDKIRAEIAECGSIRVTFAITDETKTDKGIEKLARDILARAKEQVLDIIDKYKAESEDKE